MLPRPLYVVLLATGRSETSSIFKLTVLGFGWCSLLAISCAREQALQEAAGSATITKEGLKLKQISLTDFKVTLSMLQER